MTSTTPDDRRSQAQSMTSLQTLAELIAEYEDELAEIKRDFIREYRKAKLASGLTYRDLERLTSSDAKALCMVAKGHRSVSRQMAARIAAAFAKIGTTKKAS